MLFMVGIEVPKSENEAWGIVMPAFERIDLGCVSAVDNESDILTEARDVILSMAEVALEQGHLISDLTEPYRDYSQEKNYSYCNRWIAVDVDMSAINDEQKRVNISLSTVLLARIDAVVESNRMEYKDRSNFIAMAASHEIHRNRA